MKKIALLLSFITLIISCQSETPNTAISINKKVASKTAIDSISLSSDSIYNIDSTAIAQKKEHLKTAVDSNLILANLTLKKLKEELADFDCTSNRVYTPEEKEKMSAKAVKKGKKHGAELAKKDIAAGNFYKTGYCMIRDGVRECDPRFDSLYAALEKTYHMTYKIEYIDLNNCIIYDCFPQELMEEEDGAKRTEYNRLIEEQLTLINGEGWQKKVDTAIRNMRVIIDKEWEQKRLKNIEKLKKEVQLLKAADSTIQKVKSDTGSK